MTDFDPNSLTAEQKANAIDLDKIPVVSPMQAKNLQSVGYGPNGDKAPPMVRVDMGGADPQGQPSPKSPPRGAPQDIPINSLEQRDGLLKQLQSGNLPSDIAIDVATALQKFDAGRKQVMEQARADDKSGASSYLQENPEFTAKLFSDLGPEAGIRAAEGVGQLGLNAMHFVSGVAGLQDKLWNPWGDANVGDFNKGVVQRRMEWSQDMHTKYGDAPMSAAADLSAGILASPLFLSRTPVVLKGATTLLRAGQGDTLAGTFGSETARNALFGGSNFKDDALGLTDKLGDMTVGALFPLAAHTGGALVDAGLSLGTLGAKAGNGLVAQGLKNNLVRSILGRSDPDSVRAQSQANDFFQSVGVTPENKTPMTLGQVTGDPRVISFENRFTDVRTRDYNKTQNNDLLNAASALRDQLNAKAGGNGVAGVGAGTFNAIDDTDNAIRLQRQTDWEAGRVNVSAVAKAARQANNGQPISFPIKNTVDTLNQITKDLDNPAAMADPSIRARLNNLQTVLLDAQSKGGKLTPEGLMGMLQGLNAGKAYGGAAAAGAPGGADAALEAIRSKVMDAVYQDAAAGGNAAQPVAAAIADMRQRYAFQSDALRKLQDDTMTRLFGDKSVMANPAAATDAFLKLDPAAQRYGIRILQERAPQVLYGMQSRAIETAINAALDSPKAAMAGQFDPKAFSDALYGNGFVRSGILTSDTLKQVEDAKGYLTGILNNKNAIVRPGTQVWPEDVAINVISRSPEFMARAVTRVMTGLNAEKLFVTPEGIHAMRVVSDLRNVPKESAVAAATYLGALMQDDSARQQQAARIQARAKAPMGAGGGRYGVGPPVQGGQ